MTHVAAFTRRFTRVGNTWTRYARRAVHGCVLAALTVAAVFIAPRSASACTRADSRMPCALDSRGAAIIVGTVLELVPAEATSPTAASHAPQRTYRVQISEVFNGSGKPGDVVTVTTPDGESACGYNFRVGTQYLIYAEPGSGTLTTSLCTRTSPSQFATEELALLRELKEGHPETRLMGSLAAMLLVSDGQDLARTFMSPPPGTGIAARDASGAEFRTVLDNAGRFTFRGIPKGEYTLVPDLPKWFKPMLGTMKVTLENCAADKNILLSFAGMWGTVRTPTGAPAAHVSVTVAVVDAAGRPLGEPLSTTESTDEAGEWEIAGLAPGRYAVGVNVFGPPSAESPYAPFGVTAPEAPTTPRVFEVTDTPPTIVDFQVPPPLETVTLSGRVFGPDGADTPAYMEVVDIDGGTRPDVTTTSTGPNGRFSLTLVRGRRYRLSAQGYPPAPGKGAVDVRTDSATPPQAVIRLIPE